MFDFPHQTDLPSYVRLKKSPRARRLALRLDSKERVFHLVVPRGMSMKKAQLFAEEHDRWMRQQLKELPEPIYLDDGASIPVFGQFRKINIFYGPELKRTHINLMHRELEVITNLQDPGPRIVRFLKAQAREQFEALAHEKAEMIGKRIKSVTVRDTKSRWGSCSSDKSLSFCWRLIFAPYEALDYVVAHEVAHLRYMDHSPKFWALCRDLSDDFVEGQYWMRNYGAELMRYTV